MNGKLYHLSAGGLYNGLVLLHDDETGSYWDHITGECVHGPMKGSRLDDAWSIDVTTVEAARGADPHLLLLRSKPNFFGRLMGWFMLKRQIRGKGMVPWYFYTTMEKRDQRRPRMEQGLGVVVDGRAVFYPHAAIEAGIVDDWNSRELRLRIRKEDSMPTAEWADGTRPLQLFSRWYGFSFTYPNCEIFQGEAA